MCGAGVCVATAQGCGLGADREAGVEKLIWRWAVATRGCEQNQVQVGLQDGKHIIGLLCCWWGSHNQVVGSVVQHAIAGVGGDD